ncbi:Triosephosphate isomerase [Cupriavidus taiwanensis]|uniref:Triosephosphate isomerase n=1 Tax=Cupriavidus taiwanensis TaxID=164546 RepID=A0A375FJ36_9BURK|nr:triose-phosphate isomerase [Cupriavidus taiwanensis]SOZ73118.1 Triosephosphate isomerase [Cupriavidus taiwanensis]SOZ73726.1 Triosephosphate isomerase [Cupriavidus taiwanensis]SOZ75268.1 Triosephosphate isomerase [Cupriavidus taiwanensis]SPA03751.1 Triosephosphate isomerase [Cupriavidus taiwanensis]SPA12573.1 Triosephosphate isomerase [Cupriavidus taiwanensis]
MKPLVIGNWKMNGSSALANHLLAEIAVGTYSADVAVCVPFVYLKQARELLANSTVSHGGQNVSEFKPGAFTGEISAEMLADASCAYVIVGHSERRQYFGETDVTVAKKVQRALEAGVQPVLCVGETLVERESENTEAVIGQQLRTIMEMLTTEQASRLVIAYEPVWAIGTGKSASVEQAQAAHAFLRGCLSEKLGEHSARTVPILYGGSVKPQSAASLFHAPDIDGGLIGGASLVAEDFAAIANAI